MYRLYHFFTCITTGSLLGGIFLYRMLLSPLLGQKCRFWPSCSEYAQEAILRYGPLQGGWLTLRRLAKCQPFGPFGMDPVPPKHPPCAAQNEKIH